MDFRLSEEQKSLIALVINFAKREISPELVREVLSKEPKDRLPRELMKKAHTVGLRQLTVPKKYGGGGLGIGSLLTQVVLAERIEQHFRGLGYPLWYHWKMFADLAAVGNKKQQDEFFPQIMSDPCFQLGEQITEPEHGCDPRLPYDEPGSGLKTFAYQDGNEYVINGEKGITDNAITNLNLVYVRTDKKKPLSQATSVLLVPSDSPGYSVQRIYGDVLPDLLRPAADTLFDNCRIPARYLMGEENKGWAILNGRYAFWLVFAAARVGAAQVIYELTKEYAKTRIQGGKPIFEHLTVGTKIVDMLIHIEQVRYLVYKTAWEYDQTGNALVSPLGFNLCNTAGHDLSVHVANVATEVWGGQAILKELPIEGYIRGVYGTLHAWETAAFNRIKAMSMI